MPRWKLCSSTTFEILPLSALYTVQAKILYLQSYSTDFRNLRLSSKMLRVGIWVKSLRGAGISTFRNGNVKTLRIDNIWNFATFNMYTVPGKILYLQRYSTDFRNLGLSSKILRVGIFAGKFQGRRYFPFAMARWKHCSSTRFEILPLSACTLVPAKILYLQSYSTDFRNLCLSSKMLRVGHLCWKVSGAQVFYLCNGKVKTLRIDNIWNFATFNLYTFASKNPVSPKVFQPIIRNLRLSSKMLRVGICVKSLRCAAILLLEWQRENFAQRQHLKFCHFQPVHCSSKNPTSPKAFNRFSKSLPQLEDVEGGNLGEKFKVRWYFTFSIARWKLCASITFEILPLSTCTFCQQQSYISKGIQPIFEIFASARRYLGWEFVWKV